MNILIVKPSSLGDIIHTLPVVGMIRENYPDSVIGWVVNDTYADLLDLCPDIDTRIVFKRKRLGKARHGLEIGAFIRELRSHKFDIAIDFQGLLRSAVIARLSGAERRVGFRNAREGAPFFYTDRILLPANLQHAQDKNIFLSRAALRLPETTMTAPVFCTRSEVDAGKIRKLFREHAVDSSRPILTLAPAARWDNKRWPPEFFAKVVSHLKTRDENDFSASVVCVGTRDEREIGAAVCRLAEGVQVINLMGETDLGALTELLRQSAVLLTNDSGPMHLAAAVGTPVVALFGPTDASLTGPYGQRHTVFSGTCPVAPCRTKNCPKSRPECHGSINSGDVAEAVNKHLLNHSNPSEVTP